MIERLIEYVVGLTEDQFDELAIQDVALCRVWHATLNGDTPEIANVDALPGIVDAWLQRPSSDPPSTEGRRHQTLLRDIINQVQDARVGSLARDEIDFLICVNDLTKEAADASRLERVQELLHPHMDVISKRQKVLKSAPKLEALNAKLHLVNTGDILKARAREIKVLAGIEMESRGPVLSHKGHVRVLGDVPDNCTVVVEAGDCIVDGFVMGRIAATGMCEVRKNISGTVIVRDGDIRSQNLVDNSYVVSKLGSIYCRRAHNPRLVFAGAEIDIRDEANRGRYLSPRIVVEEEAIGGEFHITERIRSDHYTQSEHGPLKIVFRQRFSCRDYGQIPTREMSKRLSEALRLRQRIHYSKQVRDLASKESEQMASNALMFLLGGRNVKTILDDTTKSQRRLDVLNRIIMGFHSIYTSGQRSLEADNSDGEDEEEEQFSDAALDQLTGESDTEEGDDESDRLLTEEREKILKLRKELTSSRKDAFRLSRMLSGVQKRLAGWVEESRDLARRIRMNELKVQKLINWEKFSTEGNDTSKLVMLRRVLAAGKKQGIESPLHERMQSMYVRIMLRGIRTRLGATEKSRESLQPMRTEFETLTGRIWDEFQVRIAENENDPLQGVKATGRYDPGVKLYADPSSMNDEKSSSDGKYFVTPATGDKKMTYECRSGSILEGK